MAERNTPRLCFIGFGEAGQAFAAGLREAGVNRIAAWDILFPETAGDRLRDAADTIGVRVASSNADAVADADIVIAAVTAASSHEAAGQSRPNLRPNQYFLDINSVSPGRKQNTAKMLDGAARYVDVAVMAPVHPARHQTPVLVAGPFAEPMAELMTGLGMKPAIAGPDIGNAAAIKMVRSVMVKGLEALTTECFLAAQRAGVVEQITASLSESYPGLDWPKQVAYNLERMANHGIRRAAEMEEVAATLVELGLDPHMARATVERQRQMGAIGKAPLVQEATTLGTKSMLAAVSAVLANEDLQH